MMPNAQVVRAASFTRNFPYVCKCVCYKICGPKCRRCMCNSLPNLIKKSYTCNCGLHASEITSEFDRKDMRKRDLLMSFIFILIFWKLKSSWKYLLKFSICTIFYAIKNKICDFFYRNNFLKTIKYTKTLFSIISLCNWRCCFQRKPSWKN